MQEDVSYDWQGSLYGQCIGCNVESFAAEHPKYAEMDEAQRVYHWRKAASKLHAQRHDTKLRDEKRLRTQRFESLLAEARKHAPSSQVARTAILRYLRSTTHELVDAALPGARAKLDVIVASYCRVKEREANDKDYVAQPGDVIGTITGDRKYLLQLLDRVTPNTRRFFICKKKNCMYFSINTNWVTTAPLGWQWLCPLCGVRYAVFAINAETHRAHYVIYKEDSQELILSEWPATAEEDKKPCLAYCIHSQYMLIAA